MVTLVSAKTRCNAMIFCNLQKIYAIGFCHLLRSVENIYVGQKGSRFQIFDDESQ